MKRHGSVLGFYSVDTAPPIISCCDCGKIVSGWRHEDKLDLNTDECVPARKGRAVRGTVEDALRVDTVKLLETDPLEYVRKTRGKEQQ